MCRFVLYLGPSVTLDLLTTRPTYSIIHQSYKARMRVEPLNGDGFGLAWYVPEVSAEGGSTDSEHLFALFQDHLARKNGDGSVRALADALKTTIREVVDAVRREGITKSATLNLAVCDGRQAVVSRYGSGESEPPSLYFHTGSEYSCEDDQCYMEDAQESRRAIMVASEPLTEEDTWQIVPPGHMMLIDTDHRLDFRSLE